MRTSNVVNSMGNKFCYLRTDDSLLCILCDSVASIAASNVCTLALKPRHHQLHFISTRGGVRVRCPYICNMNK